jgi:glycerol-3-phosphate dehydrogenase
MAMLGEVSLALLEELATIISPVLNWSQQQTETEVERTVQLLLTVHGVTLAR